MIKSLTKIIAIILLILPTILQGQTLTYSGGVWTPFPPDATTGGNDVIIDDINVNMPSGCFMNNLTINAGKSIRVYSRSITVNGNLSILSQGSYSIQSSGTVTVLGTSTISVAGNNSSSKLNAWSSPFSSLDILSTFPGVNPCDVLAFQATDQTWRYDYSVPFSTTCNGNAVTITSAYALNGTDGTPDGNFDLGKGYFSAGNVVSTRDFSSSNSFNNGTINVPIYGSSVAAAGGNDWNLIGNPYPSTVRVGSFLSSNSSLINAVYLYSSSTGGYITKGVGSTFPIAACQGFFIESTSAVDGFLGNIQFLNSHRRTNNTTFYKTESNNTVSKLYISITSNNLSDQIQILMDSTCEDGYDTKYDARKMRNKHKLNIASMIVVDANYGFEQFVFNGIKPINNYDTKTVKLFVETPSAGSYNISLDSFLLTNPYLDVKIEDKLVNTFTNLKTGSFTFTTLDADSINDRFFIHLTNTVTSIKELEDALDISIYSSTDILNINTLGETLINEVTIFDIVGRTIYTSNRKQPSYKISTSNFNSGIYIVKVVGVNGKLTSKRIFIE